MADKTLFARLLSRLYCLIYISLHRRLWHCVRIRGHLFWNEGIYLYRLARGLPEGSTIVELGSYLGRSTCFIAEGIGERDITFYTVDTFENQGMTEGLRDTFEEFAGNTARYGDKITVRRGASHDLVHVFRREGVQIDLLWIDACHKYEACKRDIKDWLPLVNEGGTVCFHDYYVELPDHGVKRAVDEATAEGRLMGLATVGHRMAVTRRPVHLDGQHPTTGSDLE